MIEPKYTKTEMKILKILSDGQRHHIEEMRLEMDDIGQCRVKMHVSNIRKKLKSKGEDIVCVFRNRRTFYQHVRLLHSPYDGRH